MADGVSTRCLEAGDPAAPCVVFLHGTGGHLEAFAKNVAVHAERYRVVAYDFPGHGGSAFVPDRSYEIDGYLQHLEALLDQLGIETAVLSGLSLGGWTAARYAARNPDRMAGLALNATGGATYDETVMAAIRDLTRDAVALPTLESVRRRLEWLMADPASVSDDLVETRFRLYRRPEMAEAMRAVLCLQEPDIRRRNMLPPEEWGAIACPTVVLWGDRDPTGTQDVARRIAAMIPGAELALLADCGHWPQFERPAAFNAAHLSFLESLPGY
jgi:2-hydroxy-6-oxonona-2,4-dienedioate hydrolase